MRFGGSNMQFGGQTCNLAVKHAIRRSNVKLIRQFQHPIWQLKHAIWQFKEAIGQFEHAIRLFKHTVRQFEHAI